MSRWERFKREFEDKHPQVYAVVDALHRKGLAFDAKLLRMDSRPRSRMPVFLLGIFMLGFIVVAGRLGYLQFVRAEELQAEVMDKIMTISNISPLRGTIYDRNGKILATNRKISNICISAKYLRTYNIAAETEVEAELRLKNERAYQDALKRIAAARAEWDAWLPQKAQREKAMESMTPSERKAAEKEIEQIEKNLVKPLGMWTFDDGRRVEVWRDRATDLVVRDMPADQMLAKALSEICGVDYAAILERYSEKYVASDWYRVVVEADDAMVERIAELRQSLALVYQVYIETDYKRVYPNGTTACHVIGFLDKSGNGVTGLERYYNDVLSGVPGRKTVARDSGRRVMPFDYESDIAVQNGRNIITTIDLTIQMELEKQLEKTYVESKAGNRVTGVALDPKSGEVLAMATYPPFDPNDPYTMNADQAAELSNFTSDMQLCDPAQVMEVVDKLLEEKQKVEDDKRADKKPFSYSEYADAMQKAKPRSEAFWVLVEKAFGRKDGGEQVSLQDIEDSKALAIQQRRSDIYWALWNNKTVSETYEPGSTFKVITTSMGFEEKLVSVSDTFSCWGSYTVEGWSQPIKCHKAGGHGTQTFDKMLQQSCNPTMMQLAERIGLTRFYNYFLSYDYSVRTGIDLPSEAYPIITPRSAFGKVEMAVYSFGQTFKVSPIRQITAISTVANGGYLMTPHLMKTITDENGNVVQNYAEEAVRQVISSGTCATISEILKDGVNDQVAGGARNAAVPGYQIAAKTGTSEKIDKDKETLRVGSCVAYAPYDNPVVSVLILCDEPMGDNVYGSVVAAPYVAGFLKTVLPYLGVEAGYVERKTISARPLVGATTENAKRDLDVNWHGIKYEIRGDGERVTYQFPAIGTPVYPDTGKVVVYTGTALPKYNIPMPNVTGMTVRAAVSILTGLGLNVTVSGPLSNDSVLVRNQSVAAGELVTEGMGIEIAGTYDNVAD